MRKNTEMKTISRVVSTVTGAFIAVMGSSSAVRAAADEKVVFMDRLNGTACTAAREQFKEVETISQKSNSYKFDYPGSISESTAQRWAVTVYNGGLDDGY